MSNGGDAARGQDLTIPEDRIRQIEQVVTERNRIQALIQKAEDGRGKVKEEIYRKVISDYEAKMSAVASSYEPVREEIVSHLRRIRSEETRIKAQLGSIHDEIEELKFRCEVGEFGPGELAERENQKRALAQGFQEQVAIIDETYARCRGYLGEDDFADAMESDDGQQGSPDQPVPQHVSQDDIVVIDDGAASPPPPPPMDVDVEQPAMSNPA